MPRTPTQKKNPLFLIALIILGVPIAALIAFLWVGIAMPTKEVIRPGVTFSVPQAESLGLNWRETFIASMDDLGIRRFRIPAYWKRVEPQQGAFNWGETDFQINELAMRQGKALLSIGLKTPRWPECWWPDWAAALPKDDEHAARLAYMTAVVERYKQSPVIEAWQVENEPSFHFGICPWPDKDFFKKEVALVQSLDPNHPVVTTDSGELATWLAVGPSVDALGVSVYRVVRLPWGWVWPYDWIPPYWYARRALLVSPWVKHIFISEFQMEPWFEKAPQDTPIETQFETFDVSRMQKNFTFSEHMQMPDIYFWGVEWWYWMKTQKGDSRFWDTAKQFFQKHS